MTVRDGRPDPDALLERAREEQEPRSRGRFSLFFGVAPGVDKTFTILETAAPRRDEGVDVGYRLIDDVEFEDTEA